ncbi:uncharacterized protein LOC110382914 [Helicoverpa armigera]|uniref:uncharacterized protein LOC110382914 n=1 Tax=Helicoverpa armigera TaxID=29058 RepID=UPI003082FD2E
MGNSCSSGQAHKDKDNVSQHSEEYTISTGDRDRSNCCSRRSPSYRVTKPSIDASADPAALPAHHLLEPSSSVKENRPQLKGPRPIGSSVSDSISLSSPVACTSPREDPLGPPMPSNVAALPEEHRCCLLGKVPGLRVRRRRAMLIYVCAADSQDCCAEKGALQCGAAARLRVRARRRGWRVHVADLHWRSPLEQQRDHRFPVLCIAELARQSELGAVVPVLFLNSGLGTPLLPHTLECADFKAALETAEDESDKALLNKWYTLDASTTPPCYRLVRGAPARWRREMAKTLNVLVRTLPQEACDAYLTTVVEQEVQHTVLMSVEAARRCVWVCRAGGTGGAVGAAPGAASPQSEPGDIADTAHHHELQRRLNNLQKDLKQHLSERNVIRASVRGRGMPGGEDEYTEGVSSALGDRLDALLDALLADNLVPAGYNGIPTRYVMMWGSCEDEYTEGVSSALGDRLDALLDALLADNLVPAGYNGIPTRYVMMWGSCEDEYTEGVSSALGDRLDALLDALLADNLVPAGYNGIPTRYVMMWGSCEDEYTEGVSSALGDRLDALLDALLADNLVPAGYNGIPTRYVMMWGSCEDEYTEGVSSALGDRLDALLDALLADNLVPAGYNGIPTSLFDEVNEHLAFCQKAAQCTSNREITLNELKTYITGDSTVPLALIGGAGCGKATLVARAVTLAHSCQPDLAVVVRYYIYTSQLHNRRQHGAAGADRRRGLRQGDARGARRHPRALLPARPRCCRQVLHIRHSYTTGDSTVPLALIGGAGCGKATLVARAVTLAHSCQPDLAVVVSYTTGDSTVPLALIGGAGCGKATLVARAVTLAHSCQPDLAVVVRYYIYTSQLHNI